ncbi:MAG TPA: Gfo/Idh/MocA family oxidoreductase, partial [Planctomicrobium sp.]|nr:Gfo/Idh/MocA family oxidoreductase [Planctomicrobium sp.]
VLAATFRRVAPFPGGAFCSDGDSCGGAILDLHVHDSDFINHLFGLPQAVTSHGYIKDSGHCDHVVTLYHYDHLPLVVAEGGWGMTNGFPFTMQYTVNFEFATAAYDLSHPSPLKLYTKDNGEQTIEIESGMGYEREIDYFLNCIHENRPSQRVTLEEAADSVRLIEAEIRSLQTGRTELLSH